VADCSRGGFQPPETHDCRQWTAVYVGSLAARNTTTGDGSGRKGCEFGGEMESVEGTDESSELLLGLYL